MLSSSGRTFSHSVSSPKSRSSISTRFCRPTTLMSTSMSILTMSTLPTRKIRRLSILVRDQRKTYLRRYSAADNFVRSMNALVEAVPDILRVDCVFESPGADPRRFWLGTFLKAEGGIDFTQGGVGSRRRASLLGGGSSDLRWRSGPGQPCQLRWFLEYRCPSGGWTRRTDSTCSIERFAKGAGKRILAADGIYDPETAAAREEARSRLRWLWEHLGL